MEVCTRFAPTISGQLHIGGLYNALLNYLYAKKYGGLFKLRLDGIDLTEERQRWQDSLQRDLDLFGLYPDQVLKQSERLEIYKEAASNLASKCDRVYHCDCTAQDLLKRAHEDDSGFYHLYRPEKYPPHCEIAQIKVYGPNSENNVAAGCSVETSHDIKNSSIHLTCKQPSARCYWKPIDIGYGFHPAEPYAVIDLGEEKDIRAIEIVWKDIPVLEYKVSIQKNGKLYPILKTIKRDRYFVDYKPSQSFPSLTSDRHNFAIVKTRYVRLDVKACSLPIDRPYFYDHHCCNLDKKLDLNHADATMRLKFDPNVTGHFSNFVTGEMFPSSEDIMPDSCWWYDRQPNLVFTSPFDDFALGVTHLIRGEDIYPFLIIEAQVALALNMTVRSQTYHGMIIDSKGYKYSKFIGSTPVREYLQAGITPNAILAYLMYKSDMISDYSKDLTLKDLVDYFEPFHIRRDAIVIDEQEMIQQLTSL